MDGRIEANEAEHVGLTVASAWLSQPLDAVAEARRGFLEGLRLLRDGDVGAAAQRLRSARRAEAPFGHLATLAWAECARLQGKEGAALVALRALGADADAAVSTRRAAWWRVLDMEATREHARGVAQARAALDALGGEDTGG